MAKYKLVISEKQAKVIIQALDLFSMVGTAQFEELLNHPQWRKKVLTDPTDNNVCKTLLSEAKRVLTGFSQNASYSVLDGKVSEENRIAYDILQVVRYKLAWDKNPKGGMQIDFDKPSPLSEEPLPEIEK